MKKFLSKIGALTLAVLCTACGSAPSTSAETSMRAEGEKTSLSFYTYNYTNTQKAGVDELVANFEAANPDVNVEIVFMPSTELSTKIQADIAAGVTPDIVQLTFDAKTYGIQNFGVQDLHEFVPSEELEEHLKGFIPAALKVAEVDGKLYGLPYTFSTPVLFYNVKLFEEAGLDPNKPPTTWEEVEQYALKIKEKTSAEGFVFGGTTLNDWLVQSFIQSNGGNVMTADQKTITFGEAEAIEAIEMLQSMRKKGAHASMNDTQGFEAFPAGNLGMMLSTSALQASMLEGAKAGGWEIRTAKMPAFAGKDAVPVNSGSGLFVCSTDPKKQEAAWRFIKYVTTDEGYTIITTKMGYPPLRAETIKDERYLKTWAEENPLVQPNLEQIEYVTPWQAYPGSNWLQIETILMDAFNNSLFNDVNVEEIMKAAQTQAQSLMP